MYFAVIYFPLLSFLLITFFGRFIGRNGASLIAVVLLFITLLISWFAFFEISISKSLIHVDFFDWVNVESFVVR